MGFGLFGLEFFENRSGNNEMPAALRAADILV